MKSRPLRGSGFPNVTGKKKCVSHCRMGKKMEDDSLELLEIIIKLFWIESVFDIVLNPLTKC